MSDVLAVATLLACASVSRTAGLAPLIVLPSARADGLGTSIGAPDSGALRVAGVLAVATLLLPIFAGASVGRSLFAGFCAVCGATALIPLARRKLGGHTGDIAGAAQQASEIAFMVAMSGGAGS